MNTPDALKWKVLEVLMGGVKTGIEMYVKHNEPDCEIKFESAKFTLDMMRMIAEVDPVVYKTIFKWNEDVIVEMLRLLNDE